MMSTKAAKTEQSSEAVELKRYEKVLLNMNVHDACLKRIEKIYAIHDEVYVSFSGGKDSLCVLTLVEEYFRRSGRKGKINVVFYDEELIPSSVIDFMLEIYKTGKYNFQWFCLQLESHVYTLGKMEKYIQWDEKRKHVRPKPEFAISAPGRKFSQYTAQRFMSGNSNRRVCFINGMRADESLTRMRAVFQGEKSPYLGVDAKNKNIFSAKVIYDFKELDVFKVFHTYGVKYCDIYDKQLYNGEAFRVSTPVHSESAKRLDLLKTRDPQFFSQIAEVFPEVDIQARYYKDLMNTGVSKTTIIDKYEKSWDGIMQYVAENVEPNFQAIAYKKIAGCRSARDRKANKTAENLFGGYPILHVFERVIAGEYKRFIVPLPVSMTSAKHYEYEGLEAPLKS